MDVLPFESPADAAYGLIRARLEKSGQPIGGNDLLIAAQALALGYTVVTGNEREFTRIIGSSSRELASAQLNLLPQVIYWIGC